MTTEQKMCSEGGCPNAAVARGLCMKHYKRMRRTGSTARHNSENKGKECKLPGCGRPAGTQGLCSMHYLRMLRDGQPGPAHSKSGRTAAQRAVAMIDTSGGPDACHPWTGRVANYLPVIRYGRSYRSTRRVLAEEAGMLESVTDHSKVVRMRPGCEQLCCNVAHMHTSAPGKAPAAE